MLPPEGGPFQIGALIASQEAWPEVARHGRKPVRQNRGGTPTGELPPPLSSPACGGGYGGGQRPCQLHGRLEQASVGVPLPFFCFVVPFFLPSLPGIAVQRTASLRSAYDPAIHAEAKVDRTFGSLVASGESRWTTGSSP